MELSFVAKTAAGIVGGSAAVGGGAYAAYKLQNRETIEKHLKSLHRELASSNEDWELIKRNYASDKEENPITGIPKSSINTKLSDLKKWCKDRLSEEFSKDKANQGDYNLIQAWCTKQVKISSHLKNLKLAALDVSGNGDNQILENLKSSYSGSSLKINEITTQSSNKTEGTSPLSTIDNIQKIKDWCSWASEQYFKYKEDTLFQRYKHFCTKALKD
ncbi:hypothetical protein HF1_04880 [Mycoplasma haemofelis str. Langford 1]|uniref:Uncharacterized protein n=1 Tax=Mycoplasma haemofelis (strain Langford 1) TaxID=941640 RepID=E8ZH75_MYCHL|nr:hypothetical protein [Mycoplasma haemofelis]CBY92496.1 hypothetical protein HF1_04880 [Mycoplasma haemofelis str. Langford 1]